jgi:hypothetical protein
VTLILIGYVGVVVSYYGAKERPTGERSVMANRLTASVVCKKAPLPGRFRQRYAESRARADSNCASLDYRPG